MQEPQIVFVVEDDEVTQTLLGRWLAQDGYQSKRYERAEAALHALETLQPDALVLDLGLPGIDGLDALRRIRATLPDLPIIIATARAEVDTVVEAMREGADDFLAKPFEAERFLATLRRHLSPSAPLSRPARRAAGPGSVSRPIIGSCAALREVLAQIQRVAAAEVPVHVSGESGSGKELVARAVHAASARASRPFVAVNCGAISETLQDSELFGHEKGAFTGAQGRHRGLFERADGGTLFLDEVAELSPSTQVRLLRVLEEGGLSRLGGEELVPVDVRVISASNKALDEERRAGRFREDLFYRLVVYPIEVPPLRERREDIPALVAYFAAQARASAPTENGCGEAPLTDAALARLIDYAWPGNVRELENTVRFALVNARGGVIDLAHLPDRLRAEGGPGEAGGASAAVEPAAAEPREPPSLLPPEEAGEAVVVLGDSPESVVLNGAGEGGGMLRDAEREAILAALVATEGRVVAAARRLGMSRATLYRRLEQFGIAASEFREVTERMEEDEL